MEPLNAASFLNYGACTAMPLDINSIIETVISWVDGREIGECVIHHWVEVAGSELPPIALSNIALHLKGLAEAYTLYCCCESTALVGVSCRVIPPSTGSGRIVSSFSTAQGAVSGENVGAQECVTISKYSDTATRSGRGRIYLPFIPESFINSGRVTSAAKTLIETNTDPLILDEQEVDGGITIDPCIYSRTMNTYYEITSVVTRAVTTTQRRRVQRKQPFAS